jgi:hypothetical protein
MSVIIFEFAKSFVASRLQAAVFADAHIELWRIERDGHLLQNDAEELSECLSSIFCAADMYSQDDSRTEYELDDEMLKLEVSRLVNILMWS